MTLHEALQILEIQEYEQRIINSNSKGELFHIWDYIIFAETYGKNEWFSKWFKMIVEHAEKTWKRPESVFQHMRRLLDQAIVIPKKNE